MRTLLVGASIAVVACGDNATAGPAPEVTRRVFEAGPSALLPNAAWTGSELGLIWTDPTIDELMFARLNRRGETIAPPVQLTDAPGGTFAQAIAWNGERYGIWFDDERDNGRTHVPYFVAVSAEGEKLGPEQPMLPGGPVCDYCRVEMTWSGSYYLAIFVEWIEGYTGQLRFAAVDPEGSLVTTRLLDPEYDIASMVWTGSELDLLLYAYIDRRQPSHSLLRLGDQGEPLAEPIALAEFEVYLDGFAGSPSIAWTGSEFGVAWGNRPVQFTRLTSGGVRTGPAVEFSEFGGGPRLLWTGSEYLVVWSDARLGGEIYVANLGADGTEFVERRITEDHLVAGVTGTGGGGSSGTTLWLGDQIATVSRDEPDFRVPDTGELPGIYFRTFFAP